MEKKFLKASSAARFKAGLARKVGKTTYVFMPKAREVSIADGMALNMRGEDDENFIVPSIARNTAPQWAFELDDAFSDRIDLCNDNNGGPLSPGLHNLQFLVTDRPFFRAAREGSDHGRLQCGVPDVAAGATYAVTNYVFECIDSTLEANKDRCTCEDNE